MILSVLIILGALVGFVIAALSHPMIWHGLFGGKRQSDDHGPDIF